MQRILSTLKAALGLIDGFVGDFASNPDRNLHTAEAN
jgi:hypothetical protein